MADDGAKRLGQPDTPADEREPRPGQDNFTQRPAFGPRGQRVDAADQAAEHQRQRAVGLQQRQRQHQRGQPGPQPPLALHCEPPQQVERREQHAPAQQRRALRHQQIDHRVYPQDVFVGVVGRGCIVAGKNRGKIRRTAEKIGEPEPAAHEKQPEGQTGLARAAQHCPRQLPGHAVHRHKPRQQRQQIGQPQRRTEQKKNARDTLAQKRVSHRQVAGQHRLHRRQHPAHRNALDVG